ncbi:transcriptional regulator [Streptomyces sp. NPDC048644]|uniref:transcriptional regulator n=1 Tax=Streptomyces sp. NPDC048644 TaxID=3365582 RepID=UPI00371048B7
MVRPADAAPRPTADAVLDAAVRALTPDTGANRLVPLITTGEAPRSVFATFALEQHQVIASDRLSFRHLTHRADGDPPVAAFFELLADGETLALERLAALADACGLTPSDLDGYQPRAGCQAYPSYAARLALGAEPVDVVIALTANFAAWGHYCAAVARSMRTHYAFPDAACGFFDFFAKPAPELDERALAAVQHGLDTGQARPVAAQRQGRLLQAYELMFWNSLTDRQADPTGG